jgi:hypothetical protein
MVGSKSSDIPELIASANPKFFSTVGNILEIDNDVGKLGFELISNVALLQEAEASAMATGSIYLNFRMIIILFFAKAITCI